MSFHLDFKSVLSSCLLIAPLLIICSLCSPCIAQGDGSSDDTFNPFDIGYGMGDGPNAPLTATLLQPDGKILITGAFTTYNGVPRSGIARLLKDGSLDPSFDPGAGLAPAYTSGSSLAIQSDGAIIISGNFESYNGLPRKGIARINVDGSPDIGFNPALNSTLSYSSVAIQPDGKILIVGMFSLDNKGVVRINSNGSLDADFTLGSGTYNANSVAIQPDKKIVIGGVFVNLDGATNTKCIVRLNENGSLDPSFDSGTLYR